MGAMKVHEITFGGSLLERGFWLYVWRISERDKVALYVGRTGDSSSQYAASPFNRLGQHLDIRPTATANTLLRNIQKEGFTPEKCKFELVSVGPLFPEQSTLHLHRKYRDIVAPLERALADHLKKKGYKVLGKHPKAGSFDQTIFRKVIKLLGERLE